MKKKLLIIYALILSASAVLGQGAFSSGNYPNLFAEAGFSQTDIDNKVNSIVDHYFTGSGKIYYELSNGTEAYIYDDGNQDVRSEGMSYGMMICVQMGTDVYHQRFDKLWKFAKTYMQHRADGDQYKGYFRWSVETNGSEKDIAPAPDGEVYFITSLLMASERWGDAGTYNYREEADFILTNISNKGWNTGSVTNMFSPEGLICIQPAKGNNYFTDPSYHLPAFFQMWSEVTGDTKWASYADASRSYFVSAASKSSYSLMPDYSNYDGSATLGWATQDADKYYQDAHRVIMNVAFDYSWFGSNDYSIEICTELQNFFASKGLGPDQPYYQPHYNLDGSNYKNESYQAMSQVACNAVGSLASESPDRINFVTNLFNRPGRTGDYLYYDGTLHMLALLHCSGKFKASWGTDIPAEQAVISGYNIDFLPSGQKAHWMDYNTDAVLQYTVLPAGASQEVEFTTNNTGCASVSSHGNGSFTIHSNNIRGGTMIYIKPKGFAYYTDSVQVSVFDGWDNRFEYQDPISMNEEGIDIPFPAGYSSGNVRFTSTFSSVISVNQNNGHVTPIGPGKAVVVVSTKQGEYWIGTAFYIVSVISNPAPTSKRVEIRALGVKGNEEMFQVVDGDIVRSYRLTQSYKSYVSYVNYNSGDVHVEFTNDDGLQNGRDIRVDYTIIGNVKTETESLAVNTGAYANGVCGGGSYTEWLHCNGSVNYGPIAVAHTITIRARGNNGGEHIDLLINGQAVNSGWWLGTSYQEYTETIYGDGDINVEYDNDGGLKDVVIDWLRVDNQNPRQAENMQYNTGAYANGYCGGGSYTQWLHCNGVIGFGMISANFKSASAIESSSDNFTSVNVYPNPSTGEVFVDLGSTNMNASVKILDYTGRLVFARDYINENQLQINDLRPGMYIISVIGNQINYSTKLIVK